MKTRTLGAGEYVDSLDAYAAYFRSLRDDTKEFIVFFRSVKCKFLIGLTLIFLVGCSQPNQYQPPPPPTVSVAKPIRQTVTNYLDETGATEPVQMATIRARVNGYLEKINFDPGAGDVKAGDVLYEIQPREYKAKVASANAEVRTMEVALNLAELELERQKKLLTQDATSQSVADEAAATRDGAIAAVDAAKAALDQAELNLEYTKVTSPIDGRIGKTLVKVGNLVGDNEATHLTTVVSYDPIYVNFNLNERALLMAMASTKDESADTADISKIKAYMRRAIDSGYPFEGHLDYADLAVDQSTGSFLVRAIFPNPDRKILPGLFVRIRVPMGITENAILIPERAVGADQAGRFVKIVQADNVVERRNVVMGSKYEDMVVISEGLNGDESIVIDGLQRARAGAKVQPNEKQLSQLATQLESVEQGDSMPVTQDVGDVTADDGNSSGTAAP